MVSEASEIFKGCDGENVYCTTMIRSERIQKFVEEIWAWYSRHKRTLPWRDLTIKDDAERAYRILVSEVMLQQTQVSRVIVIYKRFLRQFPRLQDLARASNRDVIMAWRGMGYNSRALRLRDATKTIANAYRGHFPQDIESLRSIPGIGPYTAAALLNFAFNIPTPCLDTNIRRILHRTFFGPEKADGTWRVDDKKLLKVVGEALHVATQACHPEGSRLCGSRRSPLRLRSLTMTQPGSSRTGDMRHMKYDAANWHAALMDFGSLVQTKSNPKWNICPLTAKGIMKTNSENFPLPSVRPVHRSLGEGGSPLSSVLREPGRYIGSTFVPNRIFRGRIVEALRDVPEGLTLSELGKRICIDWSPPEQHEWLSGLLEKLKRDSLLSMRKQQYILAH